MFKVYLSPSNQPLNTYNGVNENERNNCRKIANKVKSSLERCGIDVKIGLNGSGNISESNSYKPDLHIPIHTNAYNKKARGASVMVYNNELKNMKFAKPILNNLKAIVLKQDKGRGISERPDLAELKKTTAVAIYIEVDFHDVPEVARWLVSEHDLIAEAITKGVCEGAGIKYIEPSSNIKKEEPIDNKITEKFALDFGNQPNLAIYLVKLMLKDLGYLVDANGYIGDSTDKAFKEIEGKYGKQKTGILNTELAELIFKEYKNRFNIK